MSELESLGRIIFGLPGLLLHIALIAAAAWLATWLAGLAGAKTRGKFSAGSLVVVSALGYLIAWPYWQERKATEYFEHLCKTEAGEFIYKTVDNVEGIFQMRLRDGSKDYFDRIRAGDIPEDPYGHTNWEAEHPENMFVNPPWANYRFFENPLPQQDLVPPYWRSKVVDGAKEADAKYRHYSGYNQRKQTLMIVDQVANLKSRFGYTWHGINRPDLKKFQILGGETIVMDLQNKEVLAVKRGFVVLRPWAICPGDKADDFMYKFVSKVLRPIVKDT